MKGPTHPVAQAALALPAWLYGRAADLRNRFYDRPGASRPGAIPVVSVGNITVGGTGKTPTVAWIAKRLLADGARPAVVSRGYGGTAGRGPRVVSTGGGALCGAGECGDEPFLLAGMLRGVVVVVGADRFAGVEEARRRGADIAILDDGFQHRRLARDLDIVLLDAGSPFGNDRLLPAGPLREPVSGLARADIVLITRADAGERPTEIERVVRRFNPGAPILRAGHRSLGYRDPSGADVPAPARAVAFCGIGNPDRFRSDLEADRVEVLELHAYRDHHRYRAGEISALARRAAEHGAALVTTEKDLARLDPPLLRAAGAPVLALRIEAVIHDPEPLLEALRLTRSRSAA